MSIHLNQHQQNFSCDDDDDDDDEDVDAIVAKIIKRRNKSLRWNLTISQK